MTQLAYHYAIECGLRQLKLLLLKRRVEYRKYAAIDNSGFAADLAACDLVAPEHEPAALLSGYDACLRAIIDVHAPLVSRSITVIPTTPRKTNELAEGKRALRRSEKQWR